MPLLFLLLLEKIVKADQICENRFASLFVSYYSSSTFPNDKIE